MHISVIGGAGRAGKHIVLEALARGHQVTAVVRHSSQFSELPASATHVIGDASDARDVARIGADSDAVISAIRPEPGNRSNVIRSTRALMEGIGQTNARLMIVGGAASLMVPGTACRLVIDDPRFLSPGARPVGQASLDQYHLCLAEACVPWTYISPAARLEEGTRTGTYRLSKDELLLDAQGVSRISYADLAVAILDEAEEPQHIHQRFTAAY